MPRAKELWGQYASTPGSTSPAAGSGRSGSVWSGVRRYGCSHRRACGRHSGFGGFSLVASAPERAILECLLLAPERMDLVETYGLLENLRTLRPQVMQSLLESCSSVKVKRLFMFLAERAGLPVVAKLARNRIDLGKGARSIVPKGAYVAKYEIVVPRALVQE